MRIFGSRRVRRLFFILFERLRTILFRALQLFRIKRAPLPRFAMIELTHACNLKCTMCNRNIFKNVNTRNLSHERFERIMNELPLVKTVLFLGVGEPLCNPDFPEIIEALSRRGGSAHLTTNGTLLSKNNIAKFGRGVFGVSISIDSPLAHMYEGIRVGANFESVLENIRVLKKCRPDLLTSIVLVMMRENIRDLGKMVELVHSLDVDCLVNQHLLTFDKVSQQKHISWLPEAQAYVNEAKWLANKFGIILNTRPLHPVQRACLEPWLKPNISMNGNVYPCCFMNESSSGCKEWYQGQDIEMPIENYRMGNLFEEPFESIWNSYTYQMLREKVLGLSARPHELSVEELNERRRQVKKDNRFWYCDVCLYRWSAAC